jgi:hypothetical protein
MMIDDELTAYWVTYTGTLSNGSEVVSPKDHKPFLSCLTRELLAKTDGGGGESPAVLTYADGKVILSAVFRGRTDAEALVRGRLEFTEAIGRAGGHSHLPGGGPDGPWKAYRLLQFGTVQPLAQVA